MPTVDELYQVLKNAAPEDRAKIRESLSEEVLNYARAVIWSRLHETDENAVRDLAQETAAAAMQLENFQENSSYKTWVHSIAANKCFEELRRRVRERRIIQPMPQPEDEDEGRERDDEALADRGAELRFAEVETDLRAEQLAEGLTDDEKRLLEGIREGLDQNALAAKLDITPAAAETRRRRLRDKLAKKMRFGDG